MRMKPFSLLTLFASAFVSLSCASPVRSQSQKSLSLPPIPALTAWESHMKEFGRPLCERLKNPKALTDTPVDPYLAETYYDATWVFYQIGDYLKDPYWYTCAEAANKIYRDRYALQHNGGVPGYWNFTHGLTEHYLRTKDEKSLKAVLLIAQNAAFARDDTALADTENAGLSREVAYTILSYLNAEKLGASPRTRLKQLKDQSIRHMGQWFAEPQKEHFRSFMVGLTAHALISYAEKTGDQKILPVLIRSLDRLWELAWKEEAQAFLYMDVPDAATTPEERGPTPDLNLLVAPAYAWVYKKTGETRFLERADKIFQGGVKKAYLAQGKQFNQNYRWSFEYVRLRTTP